MSHPVPLVVGLIGGIGSGKSAAAAAFAHRGARVIVADELGHEALRQPAIRAAVVQVWGDGLLGSDGEIVRRRLGEIVFADPARLRRLEQIVHPWIGERIREEIARAGRQGVALLVLDAAVLLEAGWDAVCDRVVFVDAPAEVRRQRVTRDRGWTAPHWEEREAAQLPLTDKRARADHVLDNASTPDHLHRQVDALLHQWQLAPAASSGARPLPSGPPDQKMT